MLVLSIFLLSSCFLGSTGSAIEEFQANFKELVDQASKEIFLPVPAGKFQCNHVPCHLVKTMKQLKLYFEKDQMKTRVSLMEKNMSCIISDLKKAHASPKEDSSCQTTEMSLQGALKRYRRFFQKLHEKC